MPTFYNYNAEKKDPSFADIYFMAFVLAIVLVFILVAFFYGIKALIALVIKYYLWVLGLLALVAIGRHYWIKGKRRPRFEEELCEYD